MPGANRGCMDLFWDFICKISSIMDSCGNWGNVDVLQRVKSRTCKYQKKCVFLLISCEESPSKRVLMWLWLFGPIVFSVQSNNQQPVPSVNELVLIDLKSITTITPTQILTLPTKTLVAHQRSWTHCPAALHATVPCSLAAAERMHLFPLPPACTLSPL